MQFVVGDIPRFTFGFANPNHAAAMICAVAPFLWGWWHGKVEKVGGGGRWKVWTSFALSVALVAALAMTFSRTGFVVLALEAAAWWGWGRARPLSAPRRGGASGTMTGAVVGLVIVAVVWWMAPRMSLDGSILNRPRIWLAGLRLFAANPDGVGLGNSGAVASAFLLDGIPEVRTMISTHITLLAEFGWMVGWAWFAFIGLALCGVRESPRVGIAFAGLALSGCSSTVFDWAVLFDFAALGGLGMTNWALSWAMFAMFAGFGVWLVVKTAAKGLAALPYGVGSVVLAGVVVLGLRVVPAGIAPQVRDGNVICGEVPRTLALYDETWRMKTIAQRMKGGVVLPVRGVTRFPRELDWSGIDKVMLFGDCREWRHLVKGVPVECVEE